MSKRVLGILFILSTWLLICGATKTDEPVTQPHKLIINEPPIVIVEPVVVEPEPEVVELVSLGEFKLTAYCGCSKCCGKWAENRPTDEDGKTIVCGSIGKRLISNYSIAVDPTVIPYGTVVIIEDHEYEAMDCGGAIKGNRIDVFFDSHDEALEFGIKNSEIFIKELD